MNTDLEPYQGGTPEPYERPQVPRISPEFVRPRLPEVGRIRLGVTKTTQRDGKDVTYPSALNRFRFTSRDRSLVESVAALYGGKVEPWASEDGAQWQVVSDATTIPVVVPRAELAFSQWFENWDGAVCRRRCDGVRDIVRDCPCTCVDRDRECLPTTRLSVMLPSIPGLGVWRVESHGFNAAAEILGTIELAAAYGAALLPANLTLAQRTKRRPDPKNPGKVVTNRFVVPVLSITASLEEMVETAQLAHRQALGILPSAVTYPDPRDDLVKALHATYREKHPRPHDADSEEYRNMRLDWASEVLGRPVLSFNGPDYPETLTRADIQTLLDALQDTQAVPDPGPAAPEADGTEETGADHMQGSTGVADGTLPASGSLGTPAPAPVDRGSAGVVEAPTQYPDRAAPSGSGSPAEHHPQGSAGDPQDTAAGKARLATPPAEHHTAEEEREATPADGTVPAGESRSDTGLPPGAAPISPIGQNAPKRKRRPTDPTGAPNVAQAIAEKQRFMDERKTQTVVEHPGWLEDLPPEAVYNLMTFFQNTDNPEAVSESVVRVFARRNAIEHGAEWTPEQIDKLAVETWRKQ